MINKIAELVSNKLLESFNIKKLVQEVVAIENECYHINSRIKRVIDTELTKEEKAYLSHLAVEPKLASILEKIEFAQAIDAVNAVTERERAERKGAVLAMQYLRKVIASEKPKKSINPITGKPVKK